MKKIFTRKTITGALLGTAALAMLLPSVAMADGAGNYSWNSADGLRLDGSTTVYPIVAAALGVTSTGGTSTSGPYQNAAASGLQAQVYQGGSGVGRYDVENQNVDIGDASIFDSTVGSTTTYGDLTATKIGRDGICVIANNNGNAVTNITKVQILGIYNAYSADAVPATTADCYYNGVKIAAPPSGGTQATAYISGVDSTGAITSITIDNAGSGYTTAPTITLSQKAGTVITTYGAQGATAHATLGTGGSLASIVIDSGASTNGRQYFVDIVKWNQINSSLSNTRITVYSRITTSGTRDAITDFCDLDKTISEPATVIMSGTSRTDSNADFCAAVANTVNSIGYVGIGYATPSNLGTGVTVLTVNGIRATAQNVTAADLSTNSSRAYPLSRYLYLLQKTSPTDTTVQANASNAAAFINWMTTPAGQKIVAQQNFVKLVPDADINQDGQVASSDLAALGMMWGHSTANGNLTIARADINGDGQVGGADLAALGMWWGVSYGATGALTPDYPALG